MIGQTLEYRRPFPIGAVLWLVIAIGCVALAFVTREVHWAVFGILPATIAAALIATQPPEFHAELTDKGLILGLSQHVVAYHEITRIWLATRGSQAVYVMHQQGSLRIPGNSVASAKQIHDFLASMRPPQPFPVVHGAIGPYLTSQVQAFGSDKIWAHSARTPRFEIEGERGKAVMFALLATFVAWIVAAIALESPGWGGAAMFLGLGMLIGLLVRGSFSSVGRGVKNWQESSLIIGPAGLALAQGDLKGELRWKEVREVKLRTRGGPSQRRVELRVDGAQINIMDFYESSIGEIHRQIQHYWTTG
jgi:hypothetical protein